KSLRLEQTADNSHAKARVIYIGIAGDNDNVATVPAERVHLNARHRQERSRAEARGPVLAIAENVACGFHGTHDSTATGLPLARLDSGVPRGPLPAWPAPPTIPAQSRRLPALRGWIRRNRCRSTHTALPGISREIPRRWHRTPADSAAWRSHAPHPGTVRTSPESVSFSWPRRPGPTRPA